MDSANSGSLQSSSAGEEEYDSRPSFLPPTTTLPPPPTTHPHPNFSPLPFFDNPNPNPWSPTFLPSPPNPNPTPTPTPPPPPRNSKKRSRASRRAPTTVLTTDTSNFRAMVQEFTGIPTAPFSASFPRSRFDNPPYLLRPFALKPSSSNNTSNYDGLLNLSPQVQTFQSLLQSQLNPNKFSVNNMAGFRLQAPGGGTSEANNYNGGTGDLGLPGIGNRREEFVGWGDISTGPTEIAGDRNRGITGPARQNEGLMESWMCSSD